MSSRPGTAWNGLVAPAGTPDEIIDKLQRAIAAALVEPEVREKFAGLGLQVAGNTPREFGAIIVSDLIRYENLIKAANVQ